jgi:hypothetical protein
MTNEKTYRIFIKTFGEQVFVYKNVKEYSIENSVLIFTDSLTGKIKIVSMVNCEIEEEKQ